MRSFRLFLCGIGLLISFPCLAINKCTEANGKVNFQDLPCESNSKSEAVKIHINVMDSGKNPYATDLDSLIGEAKRRCNLPDLPKLPEIGWTEKRFLECTRQGVVGTNSKVSPVKINETITPSGISKQFVFDTYKSYVYIYTVNGIVTGIQNSN